MSEESKVLAPEVAPSASDPAAAHPAALVLAEIEAKLASLEGLWATEVRALVSKLKAHL